MAHILINPQSGLAEQFDPNSAQQAIQSGYHVPLVDADGNAVSAPYDEAQQLVQSGSHSQPNSNQLQDLLNVAKYDTPQEQAKTFIEGALESATGGLSGVVEHKLGISPAQEQLNRQQYNPGSHALGQASGIIGSVALAPEASIPGLISKAGEAASGAISATGAFGKAAQLVTRGAIEAGLFSAEHQINEKLLGDPNATAEHMLGQIGLSAALGGGLNLALSPVMQAIGKGLSKSLGKISSDAEGVVSNPQELTDEMMAKNTEINKDWSFDSIPIKSSKEIEPASLTDVMGTPNLNSSESVSASTAKDMLKGAAKTMELLGWFKAPHLMMATKALSLIKKVGSELLSDSPQSLPLFNSLVGINQIVGNTSKAIDKYASGIFSSGLTSLMEDHDGKPLKLNPISNDIMTNSVNPDGLIDHLSKSLSPIQAYAPETTDSFSQTVARAVTFLSSKVPNQQSAAPLDKPRLPSDPEIAQFNRYAGFMEDPASILKLVKSGAITLRDVEALSTVFPTLYNKMKSVVTEKMIGALSKKKDADIPYKTRLGLSLFLGQNLDSTITPQGISFNQMALGSNRMQQQAQAIQQTKPSKSGMSKMKSVQVDETPAQQSAQRRGRSI